MTDTAGPGTILIDALEAHALLRIEVLARYPSVPDLARVFSLLTASLTMAGRMESVRFWSRDGLDMDSRARASFSRELRDIVHEVIAIAVDQDCKTAKWVSDWKEDIASRLSGELWARADIEAKETLPLLALDACEVTTCGSTNYNLDAIGPLSYRGIAIQGGEPWYPGWPLLAIIARDCANLIGLCFGVDVAAYDPADPSSR